MLDTAAAVLSSLGDVHSPIFTPKGILDIEFGEQASRRRSSHPPPLLLLRRCLIRLLVLVKLLMSPSSTLELQALTLPSPQLLRLALLWPLAVHTLPAPSDPDCENGDEYHPGHH